MNLDWRRLRAVVLESDDWGLCAWSPDEQARAVLADTPAFRSPTGARYGGSTLESADDVRAITDLLLEFRGGDGFPPVLQANTVLASPDYVGLEPPLFTAEFLPLIDYPQAPSRWVRPGLWGEVVRAREAGVWWPELHGLHHLPEHAWLSALRRSEADARRAHEQQSPVCHAVEASGEYDASEPIEIRTRNLELAVEKFRQLFGRSPGSFCPPDYRWDETGDADAERLGLTTFQGKSERFGAALPRLRRVLGRYPWPDIEGARFCLPPRIAFEPSVSRAGTRVGLEAVRRGARTAWGRGQPAVISTHRMNYVHLDAARAQAGRSQLRELLAALAEDGAMFVTDAEIRGLVERDWSVRPIASRGALVRYHGPPREPVYFLAPPGVEGARVREGRPGEVEVVVERGEVMLRANPGEYLIEWGHA